MKTTVEKCDESSRVSVRWRRRLRQHGSALVMVLGTIAICALMIAHVAAISGTLAKETLQFTGQDALRYQAESASETAFWMHLNDKRLFPNRELGNSLDDEFRESANFPPWMLDGRPHSFDDDRCIVYMQSAENGFDINRPDSLKSCYDVDDTESQEIVDDFIDVLTDYTDEDDFVKLNGLERDDYAELGSQTLPRNGKMQFAAEIYWLPGWRAAIPGAIRPLPPKGVNFQNRNAKPSFFSATPQDLVTQLDLEDGELEELERARRQWMESGDAIEDILDLDLLTKVKAKYSFTEARVGAFYAVAYDFAGTSHVELRTIRENSLSSRSAFADAQRQTLCIWERYVR